MGLMKVYRVYAVVCVEASSDSWSCDLLLAGAFECLSDCAKYKMIPTSGLSNRVTRKLPQKPNFLSRPIYPKSKETPIQVMITSSACIIVFFV